MEAALFGADDDDTPAAASAATDDGDAAPASKSKKRRVQAIESGTKICAVDLVTDVTYSEF